MAGEETSTSSLTLGRSKVLMGKAKDVEPSMALRREAKKEKKVVDIRWKYEAGTSLSVSQNVPKAARKGKASQTERIKAFPSA